MRSYYSRREKKQKYWRTKSKRMDKQSSTSCGCD